MNKKISLLSACLALFFISGCGNNGKLSTIINGQPRTGSSDTRASYNYKVKGRRYFVNTSVKNYSKKGIASWYGPGFHGKKTANGERYNQNAMTAAHKTLPLGSIVRVENLANGRSIVVRINDRGPFVSGRIIDLSKKAASKLNMIQSGTARVKVTMIRTASGSVASIQAASPAEEILASADSGSSRYSTN